MVDVAIVGEAGAVRVLGTPDVTAHCHREGRDEYNVALHIGYARAPVAGYR